MQPMYQKDEWGRERERAGANKQRRRCQFVCNEGRKVFLDGAPKNRKVLTQYQPRLWYETFGDVGRFANEESLTLSTISVNLKTASCTVLLWLHKNSLTRHLRVHQIRLLSWAFWISRSRLKLGIKLFLSSVKSWANMQRGGEKWLQVGCNPSAISWTHTPAWLINEWKWVSRSHSKAELQVLLGQPGCTPVRVTHVQCSALDAAFKMAPWIRTTANWSMRDGHRRRPRSSVLINEAFLRALLTLPAPRFTLPRNLCSVKRRAIHTCVTGRRYQSWQSQ